MKNQENRLMAPNGIVIVTKGTVPKMIEIAVTKAAIAHDKDEEYRQTRKMQNLLRMRSYYERGLAMRASKGDTEAVNMLALDGLTYQMILYHEKNNDNCETSQNASAEIIVEDPEELSSDNFIAETVVLIGK